MMFPSYHQQLTINRNFFISAFLLWHCCPGDSVVKLIPPGEEAFVCPGQDFNFTCNSINNPGSGSISISWTVSGGENITFSSTRHTPGSLDSISDGAVMAILDAVSGRNISSTLTIHTNEVTLPITVQCNHAVMGPSSNLNLKEPPSVPVHLEISPSYSVETCSTTTNSSTTCVQLTWSLPPFSSDSVDHYILTITPSPPPLLTQPFNITTNTTTADIILLYDTAYNISVRASNCAGTSADSADLPVYINSTFEVPHQCPLPDAASHDLNVTTDTIPATRSEGSEIVISCSNGTSWNITCTASGWIPETTECEEATITPSTTQERVFTQVPSLLSSADLIGIIAGSSCVVVILIIIVFITAPVLLLKWNHKQKLRIQRKEVTSHTTQEVRTTALMTEDESSPEDELHNMLYEAYRHDYCEIDMVPARSSVMEPNIAYISSRECHNRDATGDPVSNHGDAGEMAILYAEIDNPSDIEQLPQSETPASNSC